MNPREFLHFFKTRTGAMTLFLVLLIIGFLLVHGFKTPDHHAATTSPKSSLKPQIIETVTRAMSIFHPPKETQEKKKEASVTPEPSHASSKKGLPPISLFAETPHADTTPSPLSESFAPYGRLVPCELVITVDSSTIDTPIIGLVTADVWHHGHLIIPAGTEVHGTAKLDHVRDRIASSHSWTLVWQSGKELQVIGIALDRDSPAENADAKMLPNNPQKTSTNSIWGITDGSAGLRGRVLKSDNLAELKLFTATLLSGVAGSLTQTQQTVFGSSPTNTLSNAPIMGAQQILNTYAQQILTAINRDGFYVRVPAGKPFYLYITQTLDGSKAMYGATRFSQALSSAGNRGSDRTIQETSQSISPPLQNKRESLRGTSYPSTQPVFNQP